MEPLKEITGLRDTGHVGDQSMFSTSPQTADLDAAMAKAQGEIQAAVKDKENPFFKSKYADLASVWFACREALSKNGVSVTQWPLHTEDGRLHIITRLACNGQWIKAEFSVPIGKQDAQGLVAASTYARRAALSAAVGIAPDDDDDGNEAAKSQQTKSAPAKQQQATSKPTPEQKAQQDSNAIAKQIKEFTDKYKLEGWWSNPKTMARMDEIGRHSDKAPGVLLKAYGDQIIKLDGEADNGPA